MVTAAAQLPDDVLTVVDAFRRTVARRGDESAIRDHLTWSQLSDRVDAVAGGLAALGVGHGDAVALMIANRPEFNVCDLAAMTLGAVPFSVYPTLPPEQVAYVIGDAGARIAIVDPSLVGLLPELETVVVVGEAVDGTISLRDVESGGEGFDSVEVGPDDIATLIYTSGTTGPPKGVELTHRNVLAAVRSVHAMVGFPDEGTKVVSWLPPAHIAERNAHHYIPIAFGGEITCCPDARQVVAFLPEVRPTWFFAVPRVWEKIKSALEAGFAKRDDRTNVEAALAAAIEKVRLEQRDEPVPDALAAQVAAADGEYFAPIRRSLGLDESRALHAGGAPTPVDVLEFLHAIGLPVGELWGLSEAAGAGSVNPPGGVRIGTVGPPSPGVELRLAGDGEVLLHGDTIMRAYRNAPSLTTEAIDADGWLHTGDVGALDEHGYLKIIDRKKELIISAGGKNMSPTNIEAAVKAASPLIGQAMAVGDRRPYVTALVVLDPEYRTVVGDDESIRTEVDMAIRRANTGLSQPEQVKRYTIVDGDWLPGGDELTPTSKLKRKPIAEKYSGVIDAMYDA
jgi:long-subunit acyl-CoA synthetase (AMP-forming)